MDRTVYDKLESNTASLKGVLDDYYLGRYEDRQAVKDLTERLFQLAHGYDPAALLAACEAFSGAHSSDPDGEGVACVDPQDWTEFDAAIARARGQEVAE